MALTVENTHKVLDMTEERQALAVQEALAAAMDQLVLDLRNDRVSFELPREFRDEITRKVAQVWTDSAAGIYDLMFDEFKSVLPLEVKDDRDNVIRQLISQYIDRHGGRRSAQIIQTTERQMLNLVRGGMAKGESADAIISQIVNKIPGVSELRGTVITRTEAHAVSQFTAHRLAARASIPLHRDWNTAGDHKVRDFGASGRISEFNHRVMNGQQTQLLVPFQVPKLGGGVENLMYPGDPAGSAGNIINCRCVQTFSRIGG